MTLAELRAAFNESVRTNQVETFAIRIMPKVFELLEYIELMNESQASAGGKPNIHQRVLFRKSNECRIPMPAKKPVSPNTYTGK